MSTCVGSLSGGSATAFRELGAFGGWDAREGSGIGGRFGLSPAFAADNVGVAGFMLGVLSRSSAFGRVLADVPVTAGVSMVGANLWISVRDESGAGAITCVSVRDPGGGVGNLLGSAGGAGGADAPGLCAGHDVPDGGPGRRGETGGRAAGIPSRAVTEDGGPAAPGRTGAPRMVAEDTLPVGMPSRGPLGAARWDGATEAIPSRSVGAAAMPSGSVFGPRLSRDDGTGGALGITAVISRLS